MTLFDCLAEITYYKSDLDFDLEEVDNAYEIYMINRYLSMIELFIPFIQMINIYDIDKRSHYNFLKDIIPKGMYQYNYVKRLVEKNIDTEIDYLCRYYEIGKREALQYIELMKPEQIKRIMDVYKYGQDGRRIA